MSKLFNELEKVIQSESQKYYSDGTNTLDDTTFDALVNKLSEVDPESSVLSVGWGYSVDSDNTLGNKTRHKYGLIGSLDKFRNLSELKQCYRECQTRTNVSLKLDGISVVLYYKNGVLTNAVTRGDGRIGIDIYDKIKHIDSSVLSINEPFTGAVRGEILMPNSNFEDYHKDNPEAKNPRNATAGLINRKDGQNYLNLLKIVVYTVVGQENDLIPSITHNTVLKFLNNNFDNVVPNTYVYMTDLTENNFQQYVDKLKSEWYSDYPADGLVFTFSCYQQKSSEICYDSIAFKYEPESAISTVTGVLWDMSKTHYAIPRIHIEPVSLSGTSVEFATGFNAKYICDNHIGPGSIIEICKSNEIIPYIKNVISSGENSMISECPECNEPLCWEGVHLKCNNPACANSIRQDTLCWINTLAKLDNFGDQLRLKYLNNILSGDISIETLMQQSTLVKASYMPLSGAQDMLFLKFINLLFTSRIRLADALKAINVPRLGDITCNKLSQYPDVVFKLMEGIYDRAQLSTIIGNANSEAIIENIHKFRRLSLIVDRIDYQPSIKCKGYVVVTGRISVNRSIFEDELNKHGYQLSSTVNKDTICLITDNPNSGSSKNKLADKFGVTKLSESEFRNTYLLS